jgi:hypothetical protein
MSITLTDVPDDGTFYREESEQWKNYSLQRAVLEPVIRCAAQVARFRSSDRLGHRDIVPRLWRTRSFPA